MRDIDPDLEAMLLEEEVIFERLRLYNAIMALPWNVFIVNVRDQIESGRSATRMGLDNQPDERGDAARWPRSFVDDHTKSDQ